MRERLENLEEVPLKVVHLGYSDRSGGAARAASRIHESMVELKESFPIVSKSYVIEKRSDDRNTTSFNTNLTPYRRKIGSLLSETLLNTHFIKSDQALSLAFPSSGIGRRLNREYKDKSLDLVQLHWVGYGTISIEEIGRLQMPVFWRLADQWAFLGGEHYYSEFKIDVGGKRYVRGYSKQKGIERESGFDINRWVWQRKKKSWKKKMGIICPSNWMQECVGKSLLMHNFPTRVIPTAMDLEKWSPGNKSRARTSLGLPLQSKILLLTAEGGLSKDRKGGSLLIEALEYMKHNNLSVYENLVLVTTGQRTDLKALDLDPKKVINVGHINDDKKMVALYRSADVVVIPSLQDNLPGTGLEAQSCGIPVVAFRVGGLADVVEDHSTGLLAESSNIRDLCNCLTSILTSNERVLQFGFAARERAILLWNQKTVIESYYDFYREVLDGLKCENIARRKV